MSLDLDQALAGLATGQAMLVAPALGDSYTGKTAGSIAFCLFLLANGLEARLARRRGFALRIEALLADAPPAVRGKASFAAAIAIPDADDPQRFDRLLGALAALHAWADGADRALAVRCLDLLVDWAESEHLALPDLPG